MARTKKRASDLIDKQLARYREMRDFETTTEPRGEKDAQGPASRKALASQFPFVVQKHRATRLHYDFRLGLHGTLKSWAVTKGPSYVPADKRLAVQVEDHPMEYGGFEGMIPKGQYGGGTVMLWDEGTWEPVGDPDEGLAKGNLKFILYGKKLQGKWVLVRMGGRAAREDKPNWLLIKEHDEYERKPDDPSILDEEPDSVISGRSLDEIAGDEDHVWQSSHPQKNSSARSSLTSPLKKSESTRAATEPFRPQNLPGKHEKLPEFIPPQLAKQALKVPTGGGWLHELKLDGYRIQAHLETGHSHASVKLFSRNGLDWTHRMPAVVDELARLRVEGAVLDGEVVVLDKSGQTSFADLQAAFEENKPRSLTYFVFDLLHLNGHNLRSAPLRERKRLLSDLLQTLGASDTLRFGDHLEVNGEKMFSEACRLGAEGIVSKRASAAYTSGRGSSWIKVKCIREQEFVVGGFTLPSDGSHGVGALLLGYYEDRRLRYAGRTGTGFTRSTSRSVRDRLEKLRTRKSPFDEVPVEARRGVVWVKPGTVAQVRFSTWTADHRVRQASFKGIREDKAASEVRREEPDPTLENDAGAAPKKTKAKTSRSKDPAHADASSAATSKPSDTSAKTNRSTKTHVDVLPQVRVTHPDKIIDPETRLTKQTLVNYYLAVADYMLPHITGRPLSLVRCPDGAGEHCFFQKHLGSGMPDGVEGVKVPNKDGKGTETYVTVSTAEGLAGLAQMNVLEVHAWGSTNEDLEHPDRIIFDLDPDEAVSWRTLSEAAAEVRDRLRKIGLKSFLKSTGGKGLHIVAPVRPEYDWNMVKSFAHAFTLQMEKDNPRLYISKMTKAARKKKIFVDYMRNERGATAIAPYSSRARLGIGAALPLPWPELEASERPHFPVAEFARWEGRLRRDPWKDMVKTGQRIPAGLFESDRK